MHQGCEKKVKMVIGLLLKTNQEEMSVSVKWALGHWYRIYTGPGEKPEPVQWFGWSKSKDVVGNRTRLRLDS